MDEVRGRLRTLCAAAAQQFPEDGGLLEAVEEVQALLATVPQRFPFEGDALLELRPFAESPHLEADVRGWLGFLCHSLAYQTQQLLAGLLDGLDEADPLRAMQSARALVERAALLNDAHTRLSVPLGRLVAGATGATRAAALLEARSILYQFADATKLNLDAILRGDPDAYLAKPEKVAEGRMAKGVLSLIKDLPQAERDAARMHYAQLCEFVHPNGLSLRLMLDEFTLLPDGRARYEVALRPTSERMALGAVHVLSIPVRHSLFTLGSQLGELLQRFRELGEAG